MNPDDLRDDLRPVQEVRADLDAKITMRNSGSTTTSCDGHLLWNSGSGFFIYNDENVFVNVSSPGAKNKMILDMRIAQTENKYAGAEESDSQKITFTPENDFATVAGVKLDDSHWFIFSSCWSGNIG